jgi:hypothetical protein
LQAVARELFGDLLIAALGRCDIGFARGLIAALQRRQATTIKRAPTTEFRQS